MAVVAVVGASGLVGGLLVEALRDRGLRVVAIGRDERRVTERLGPLAGGDVPVATFVDGDTYGLAAALEGCDLAISAIGGSPGIAAMTLAAAGRAGVALVDVAPEQAHVEAVYAGEEATTAVGSGAIVVAGAGLQHLIGDSLAHLAGHATSPAREIHVAYALPDRRALLGGVSDGRRRSAAEELVAPMLAFERGRLRREGLAEQRRLAWFPRPVGPAHAASIPGAEALTVPRHVPGVATVRTYVALSGWRTELLQFAGNLVRFPRPRRVLVDRVARSRGRLDDTCRAALRWACVAEADGAQGVARAWAYGHDPVGLTVQAAVVVAERLLAGGFAPGVLAPAQLGDPADLLDGLASRTDLRWSIRRP